MKLKTLYILLFIAVVARAQETRQNTITENQLIHKAIETLNINNSKTEFVVSRVSPSNSKETIIVIPEVVNITNDGETYELNTNIVIANNSTGNITHTFYESSKTNGWVSNAIFIYEIAIDTTNYKLNTSKNAFGVIVKFRTMSQPNPYYSESLSLFAKDKNTLNKVLDFYEIYESFGEVNVNGCDSKIEVNSHKLSMSNIKTNTFNNILITKTNSEINHSIDNNGDCNPKETIHSETTHVLKFDKTLYKTLH